MSSTSGPDVAIVGAARSGTSFLAASLGAHPAIDPGAVKEPEYFGRYHHRGPGWYESLYEPRRAGLLRLDASMSYTVPTYPEALGRLAAASPDAYVIYAVRDPLQRALSHYRLLRQYFAREEAETFGAALRTNPVYLGTGDYSRWLRAIYELFPRERVLVTPFAVTTGGHELTDVVFRELGLPPAVANPEEAEDYRNEVVEFRHGAFLRARRAMMRSGAYPWVRRRIGGHRMRQIRSFVTREAPRLALDEALATCDDEQIRQIRDLCAASAEAVTAALTAQDQRLSLSWATLWENSAAASQSSVESLRPAKPD